MAMTSSKQTLDEALAGPVDRDTYDQVAALIYESYTSVDLTSNRMRQMESRLQELSGEEERDLTEKLGILCVAMGQFDEGIEKLTRVRTRKTASHFLGRAYLGQEHEEEALECLENGRVAEDDLGTDVLMIGALCRLRREEEAGKLLSKYRDVEAPSADLEYARGRVAEALGAYDEAMKHYEATIDKDPEHAGGLFRLALNCDLNGEDVRAVRFYERCVNLRPTFVGALVNLGVLYEDHGKYERAIDCYKRVLAIDPRHRQAQLYLKDAESSLNMLIDVGKSRRMQLMDELFSQPLSDFELSARSRDCLDRLDIKTLGGLTKVTRDQLLGERNFGDTSLDEIEKLLARYNLEVGENRAYEDNTPELDDGERQELLDTPLEELDLSTRARKCIERLAVDTVGELQALTEGQLLACPNFGMTSLNEVSAKLAELGLSLKSE